MTGSTGNAPAWLFAFVDLAFLLLLGMTQLPGSPNAPELGQMPVPRIGGDLPGDLPAGARDLWQLRVHEPDEGGRSPFELVASAGAGERLSSADLQVRLAELKNADGARPLLAPHADSRSQDFLAAVQLIEEVWPSRRRVIVGRVLERR